MKHRVLPAHLKQTGINFKQLKRLLIVPIILKVILIITSVRQTLSYDQLCRWAMRMSFGRWCQTAAM